MIDYASKLRELKILIKNKDFAQIRYLLDSSVWEREFYGIQIAEDTAWFDILEKNRIFDFKNFKEEIKENGQIYRIVWGPFYYLNKIFTKIPDTVMPVFAQIVQKHISKNNFNLSWYVSQILQLISDNQQNLRITDIKNVLNPFTEVEPIENSFYVIETILKILNYLMENGENEFVFHVLTALLGIKGEKDDEKVEFRAKQDYSYFIQRLEESRLYKKHKNLILDVFIAILVKTFKDFPEGRRAADIYGIDYIKSRDLYYLDADLVVVRQIISLTENLSKSELKDFYDALSPYKEHTIIQNILCYIANQYPNDLATAYIFLEDFADKLPLIVLGNSEYDKLNSEYTTKKNDYEKKLKEINDIRNKMKKELKTKEEQLLVMKMNNEKITSLYEQKSVFLEKEATSWKNRYHDALVESKNRENELNQENIQLKEQNKLLIKLDKKKILEENKKTKKHNSFSNTFINKENSDFNNIIKIENILDEKNISRNANNDKIKINSKDLSFKNSKSKFSVDGKENKVNRIQEQLITINKYKDNINSSKDFKCKFCFKDFSFPEYKEHFNICDKNPLNNNSSNRSTLNTNKIIINTSNLNTNNKRNNNSDFLKETTNTSKSSNNKRNLTINRVSNNSNNIINNDNNKNNETKTKKYININYDNINNIRIDTDSQNNINYKINKIGKNNFNNINIKINNQNININRNLININNIKKITNNINLNNYINSSSNMTRTKNNNSITNNNSINKSKISHLNHSNYIGNLSKDYIQNFNPKLFKIKIVKGRIRKDKSGKPYLEYMIELIYLNKKWTINKRFSQFTNLYKNLKKMEIQEGISIPESANIFSNIGTVFSGLSHENKIINLEKFLKDISMNDEINSTSLYRNFFETEHLYNDFKITRKNSRSDNPINNKNNGNVYSNDINFKKINDNSRLGHQNKKISSSSFSNNIENKLERMVQEIKASKAYKKIPIGNKEFNLNYFEPKTMNNTTFERLKFSTRKNNND